jgi:hypothetical protein
MIETDFRAPPGPEWNRYVLPGSGLIPSGKSWRFVVEQTPLHQYTDAQIDDYAGLRRGSFRWKAPLSLTVRARFSHEAGRLRGTAGFGFWNDPFAMSGKRIPALPRAVWFFYASPESNMKLALDTPGHGWKAATLDAIRLPFFALAPLTPLAVPLMNIKPLYRAVWPLGQKAIGVREAEIDAPMTEWHTYHLEWGLEHTRFTIDDQPVLEDAASPHGRLGFVMWLDNQAMTITPWGRVGWGTLEVTEPQWMEIDTLRIVAG